MRTEPTLSVVSGTDYYYISRNGTTDSFNDFSIYLPSNNLAMIYNNAQASGTAGQAGSIYTGNASAFVAFQAEL
jgi:hypothetical protein